MTRHPKRGQRNGQSLVPRGGIVRGTRRELRQYCKHKNLPERWIKRDRLGYYLKHGDRGRGRN